MKSTPGLAGYDRIPSAAVQLIYRLLWAPARHYDVLNRFGF